MEDQEYAERDGRHEVRGPLAVAKQREDRSGHNRKKSKRSEDACRRPSKQRSAEQLHHAHQAMKPRWIAPVGEIGPD